MFLTQTHDVIIRYITSRPGPGGENHANQIAKNGTEMADTMSPPQEGGVVQPVTPDVPTPDQNMSYMVQWWIFASIAAGGYLLILRRVARHKAGLDRRSAPPDDDGDSVYVPPASVSGGPGQRGGRVSR